MYFTIKYTTLTLYKAYLIILFMATDLTGCYKISFQISNYNHQILENKAAIGSQTGSFGRIEVYGKIHTGRNRRISPVPIIL